MKKRWVYHIWAVLFCCAGFFWHFAAYQFFDGQHFFGNQGDGIFNLWLLETAAQKFSSMNLLSYAWFESWPSSRIFWPESDWTYTRSDNLFIYGPLYGWFKTFGFSKIESYALLSYAVLAACFFATWFFLKSVFLVLPFEFKDKKPLQFLLLMTTYLCVFSESKMRVMGHWQTFSYFWVVLAMSAMLRISISNDKDLKYRRLCLIGLAFAQTSLMLSALYYAVLCLCLILGWLLLELASRPRRLLEDILAAAPYLVPFGVVFTGVAYVYHVSPHYSDDLGNLHYISVRVRSLLLPSKGLMRSFLDSFGFSLPMESHESTGYVGIGCLVGMSLFIRRLFVVGPVGFDLKKNFYLVLLLCFGLAQLGKFSSFMAYLGWIPFLVVMGSVGKAYINFTRRNEQFSALLVLSILFFILIFGMALGPHLPYKELAIQPSVWGVLKAVVPGVDSVRAVGRLATVGQQPLMLALILGFIWFLQGVKTSGDRIRAWGLAWGLCLIQFVDTATVRSDVGYMKESDMTASLEDAKFWHQIEGPLAVFPTIPTYRNTREMVYFSEFKNIKLLNGYSSSPTQIWKNMMDLALNHGGSEPTKSQLEQVESLGVGWVAILKDGFQHSRLPVMQGSSHWQFESETENYLVFRGLKTGENISFRQ